jgi:hypothetical protein
MLLLPHDRYGVMIKDLSMHAIPTTYNGINFRSRLEAKYAAFFDLLGWKYEYEPVDFRGWIPDFVITNSKPIYVEIKPVFDFPEDIAKEVNSSGCADEVIIFGTTPIRGFDLDYDRQHIGWLREGMYNSRQWGDALLGVWQEYTYGFCHKDGFWRDRVTGCYESGSMGIFTDALPKWHFETLWKIASNRVQWKRK